MDYMLTKDAERLLHLLFKQYLERRKSGISKADAIWFGGSDWIQGTLLPKQNVEDVDEAYRELAVAGFVDAAYCDDMVGQARLTTSAISTMEHRFGDSVKSIGNVLSKVIEFLAKFIP